MKRLNNNKNKKKTNFGEDSKRGRKPGSGIPTTTFTKKMVKVIQTLNLEGYAFDKIAEMASIPKSTIPYYKNSNNIKRNISKNTLNFLTVAVGINESDTSDVIKQKLITSWRKRIAANSPTVDTDMPTVSMDNREDLIVVLLKKIHYELVQIKGGLQKDTEDEKED